MKIVQSFWAKPLLETGNIPDGSRSDGGWAHRKLNYFSWTLSCLQLRAFYDSVELVTDDLGKDILIGKLKLPYTKVSTALNDIKDFHSGLWAIGKVYTYSLQQHPFLHVDNDVFIWKKFTKRLSSGSLVAQNRQMKSPEHTGTFHEILSSFPYIPDYLEEHRDKRFIPCSNAGIIGGKDTAFFQSYAREVFLFLENNKDMIERAVTKMNVSYLNVIFEQVIFYSLAGRYGHSIAYLFPRHDDVPRDIGLFQAAEKNNHFVHCLGEYKKNRTVYLCLEDILKSHYPTYHERIEDLIRTYEL